MLANTLLPEHEIVETFGSNTLSLFAVDDEDIRLCEIEPAIASLSARLRRGTYSPLIAETMFFLIATRAALKYERLNGTGRASKASDITCFTLEDRKRAALILLRQHAQRIEEAAQNESL